MVTYTYKMKPKARRDGYLGDLIDRHNMLWNKFVWLEEVSRKRRGKHINGNALDRYVNLHKKGHGWDYMIAGMDAQSVQATIQRREVAFDRFFKYAKAKKEGKPVGKKEAPPRFKRVKGEGSFTMKQTGWRIGDDSVTIGNFIKKDLHEYRFWGSRPTDGKTKTMTVRRDALGDLWLHVVTDAVPLSPLPKTGVSAGFDFDADHFFVDSHGRHWDAPRIYFKYLADLQKLDRRIARCKKGSNNQKRLYKERSRQNRDIKNIRDDWQWKLAWDMCRTYDVLCFENLDVADMRRRHKAKEKLLSVDDKKILRKWRRKIGDYAPGGFIEKVKWIAKKTGKKVLIDPSKWDPTSQKCHECGFINKAVKNLSVKKWKCPKCETEHDRDINAAINVEACCIKAEAEAKSRKESKGTKGCAGGASSVDVGQSGNPARESRWARIRKSLKPQGGDAGLAEGDLHGTQTHDNGSAGRIPQASAVGGCQKVEVVEIKVSKSDLRRELEEPEKHNVLFEEIDYYSLAAPEKVIDLDIIPKKWGVYAVSDGKLVTRRRPLALHDEPRKTLPRSFAASFLRAAKAQNLERTLLADERQKGYDEGYANAKRDIGQMADELSNIKEIRDENFKLRQVLWSLGIHGYPSEEAKSRIEHLKKCRDFVEVLSPSDMNWVVNNLDRKVKEVKEALSAIEALKNGHFDSP